MKLSKRLQEQLLKAISSIGAGATISEIEKEVKFERHTVSKYLSFMEGDGLIYHEPFGKAKVWFINKAPLQTVLNAPPAKRTFTEKVLSDMISVMPGLVIIDKAFTILFMNKTLVDAYGNLEGEFLYTGLLGQKNPLKLKKIVGVIEQKNETAELQTRDKNQKVLHIKASRLVHPDRSFSIMLIVEDITEQKQIEDDIQKQKTLLEGERQALNESAIVAETDLNGDIIFVNDAFVKRSGYSRKELLGQNLRILGSGFHSKLFFTNMWSTISKGNVWKGQIKNKAKKGSVYWVDSTVAPVLGKDKKPEKYIAICFDISRQKRLEEALQQFLNK